MTRSTAKQPFQPLSTGDDYARSALDGMVTECTAPEDACNEATTSPKVDRPSFPTCLCGKVLQLARLHECMSCGGGFGEDAGPHGHYSGFICKPVGPLPESRRRSDHLDAPRSCIKTVRPHISARVSPPPLCEDNREMFSGHWLYLSQKRRSRKQSMLFANHAATSAGGKKEDLFPLAGSPQSW